MSERNSPIVGSVFERKPAVPPTAPTLFSSGKTGFPAVQHRSKSAFARRGKNLPSRHKDIPSIIHTYRKPKAVDPDEWRKQISRENQERVEGMTEEEREEERKEILARFGAGVGDLLKRVQQARDREAAKADEAQIHDQPPVNGSRSLDEVPITSNDQISSNGVSPPTPALSTSSTRPPSRADRRLRFAELSPQDVHVYESAPPSPRRKALALPPPPDDGSAVSLGQWKGSMKPEAVTSPDGGSNVEPEEGSAEYIRRRYFPDAPANDPNLAWMEQSLVSLESEATSSPRFDLTGKPVPPSLSSTLPTHLGLHHHAEGEHAGYTLDDVFLLSRSSVPAQRATMLGVLVRIARRVARLRRGEEEGMGDLRGKEEELRTRIIAAGVEAMSERGSVGARAIEVIWQCVVGWDEELMGIEGVELEVAEDEAINSLPLDFILPQVATFFAEGELTGETMLHLLDILYRLALHNNAVATTITTTPKLIPNMVQTFLLTPIPATDSSSPPNPLALELLAALAKASRSNAAVLQDIADALLRFVTMLPPASPYPGHLATSLLISTLRFYTALASYGFYSHIASTAMTPWTQLMQYILSDICVSRRLMATWTELLETWVVCAVDPHRTTPTHEILWSQIVGWGWQAEVGDLSTHLGVDQKEWDVWAGIWRVQAAWLEGSRVNAVRGGSSERAESINTLKSGFEDGREKEVVLAVVSAIQGELSKLGSASVEQGQVSHLRAMAGYANALAAAIRLWLACLPPLSDGPLDSPPFILPFSQLSELCHKITLHPLWSSPKDAPHIYVYHRPLSGLLSCYLQLSRRLPDISQELWVAQSLTVVCKLLPGDEDCALQIMEDLTDLLTGEWTMSRGIHVPSIVWERGGMSVIKPFLSHTLRPRADIYIGPLRSTPRSTMLATTQRLPSASAIRDFGLPANRDWTLSPLDHLLRSGSSPVFKSLPASWDASEAEITRASVLLTNIAREVLDRFSLTDFVLTREEATFGCMKVFMLEHGQPQSDSAQEVFRDRTVEQFMEDLVRRYTVAASRVSTSVPATSEDLEKVATRFLGKTPFYQYYTDFLALYDAISFSHPLFARLLLPPASMRYAIDYRKQLWSDYAHVPKTIRIPVDEVICQDIREYLWPIESNAQMVGYYLRSLLKDALQGFVHLVALHHVASNVWQDIHNDDGWNEDRASKLLAAVVEQGSTDVIRQVMRYQQRMTGECLVQPRCFDAVGEEVKVVRLRCLDQWGGQALVERLKRVFDE